MRPRLALSATIALLPLAVAIGAAAEFSPGLGVGFLRDGNGSARATTPQPNFGALHPELTVDAGSRLRMRLFLRQRYEAALVPPGAPSRAGWPLERTAGQAALTAAYAVSRQDELRVTGRVTRSRDVFDIGGRPAAQSSEMLRWIGVGRARISAIEGDYRLEGWTHHDPRTPEALSVSWNASVLPLRSAYGATVAGWRQRQMKLEEGWALRERRPMVGLRIPLPAMHWTQVEVGASEVRWTDARTDRAPALTVVVDGSPARTTALTAEVTVNRLLPTAVKAGFARPIGGARFSLGWESGLDVDRRLENALHQVQRLAAEVQDTLARANVIGLTVEQLLARPYLGRGSDARITNATGWLLRRIRPWLSGIASVALVDERERGHVPLRRLRFEAVLRARP